MDNRSVAAVLSEMADLLDIQGGDPFRSRAFRQMSRVVESVSQPLEALLSGSRLEKLPGLGPGASRRIKEILRTGTFADLERLRGSLPHGLRDLAKVEGLGPRNLRVIYQNLRITSLDQLEQACRAGRVAGLPGIGVHTEEKLLRAIDRARSPAPRLLLPDALQRGEVMARAIREVPGVIAAEVTGSARRRKETVQDLDLCVAADDRTAVAARFVSLPDVIEILVRGDGRASVKLEGGHQADLRVVPEESFGAALHYFTGSQLHNVYLRARANRKGLKISDHGIFWRRDERRLSPGRTEAEIFASVGLPYIAPELRENLGELEAAERGELPRLLEVRDLRGDLRVRPKNSRALAPLVRAAVAQGYTWLAVSEPTHEGDLAKRLRKLEDRVGLRLLSVAEVAIRADGSLALDAAQLSKYDWVVGVPDGHPWPSTAALVAAMRSGLIDCLAHSSGRRLPSDARPEVEVDTLLREARKMSVALELDADPTRLDLHSAGCKQARELGVFIALASSASDATEVARVRLGVDQARRGWLEPANVLNCLSAESIVDGSLQRRSGAGPRVRRARTPKPGNAEEGQELRVALQTRTIGKELRDRLELFFRGEPDPQLEAALRELGTNPLQITFELLSLPPLG